MNKLIISILNKNSTVPKLFLANVFARNASISKKSLILANNNSVRFLASAPKNQITPEKQQQQSPVASNENDLDKPPWERRDRFVSF